MALAEDRIIHRFIKNISEYEQGGEYYNITIPADVQAYAIYPKEYGEKVGLYYVLGDDVHTYTEIRDGNGTFTSSKEYPVFTQDDINTINNKADISYVDAQIDIEKTRAESAENVITTALNDETARAVLEEDKLNKKIIAEQTRAEEAENTINNKLTAHIQDNNNPHLVTAEQLGLENVDNTSDLDKPISNAAKERFESIETDLLEEISRAEAKENEITNNLQIHIQNKDNPHSVTKAQLGLENVDNTSDLNKPISTATNAKFNEIIERLTSDEANAEVLEQSLNSHKIDFNNPHKVTKEQLNLGNVDNTSDLDKPISTATQNAINEKANKSTTLSGYGIIDAYTKDEINQKLTGAFHYKGSVESVENLPTDDNIQGDVYNVNSTGANYAWDGSKWDKLSETIDLTPYLKKEDADIKYITKDNFNSEISQINSNLDSKVNILDLSKVGSSNSYTDIDNKPQINSIELVGNKTLNELGIQAKGDYALKTELPTNISNLTNDAGFITKSVTDLDNYTLSENLATVAISGDYNDLTNKPQIPDIPENVSAFTNDAGYLTEHQDISMKADTSYVNTELAKKQNTLTFDDIPTNGSNNPVKSNGIYAELNSKQNIINGSDGEVLYYNRNGIISQSLLNEGMVVLSDEDLNLCKNSSPSFEEVFNNWKKFSHLNGVDNAKPTEMDDWQYNAELDTIVMPTNTESYCGYISPKSYSSYDIQIRLYSDQIDDDVIGLVAAFGVDSAGKEHTLSFLRTPWNNSGIYKWVCKVDHCTYDIGNSEYNQILLADKTSAITIPADASAGWSTATIGTGTIINMTRNGNVITAKCSQFNSSVLDENTLITIDLDELSSKYPVLNIFKGSAPWGYSTFSQPNSMYENILVTDPDGYIFDVKNNAVLQYDSKSKSWAVVKELDIFNIIGAGRLSYNKVTGKLFYCTGNSIFQIATNTNI